MKNWFIHTFLKLPYQLHCRTDQGQGRTVLLLHGIASSGASWRHVLDILKNEPVRVITFDLLGFGKSPKPTDKWVTYSVQDHARAVIASLKRRHVAGPVMVVGHSMGCFVAVEVATIRPNLVGSLLLYEPPFYVGLPDKSAYKIRLAAYFKLYRAFIKRQPSSRKRFRAAKRFLSRLTGFKLQEESWIPFQRSLQNTILQQTALEDLKKLSVPTQILYGRFDQLVFNDKNNALFRESAPHVEAGVLPELHAISPRASKVIAQYILEKTGISPK